MKLINNLKNVDFIYWSLLVFCLFPILPNRIKGLSVIFLLLFSLFKFKRQPFLWKDFFVNSSIYLLFCISFLFFNEKVGESKQVLETTLSILIIPIIFTILLPSYKFNNKLKFIFLKGFVVSTSIFAIVIIFYVLLDSDTYYYSNWYINKVRTLIEKVPYIGLHPIYASVFSAISILFLFQIMKIKNIKFRRQNLLFILCFIINAFFLILLSSRGVIIALLLSFFIYTFLKIKRSRHKIYLIILFSVIMSLLFQYNRRMKELINFQTYARVDSNFSNSYRVQIYKCGYKLLHNNIITGYGVGNVQLKLNECYLENNAKQMVGKYNTHNQYLDITLKTGVLGLFLFLFFLIWNIRDAIKSKNNLLILIIIFYSIVFLTENILLRQSGVILFYFLILFLNKFIYVPEKISDDQTRFK